MRLRSFARIAGLAVALGAMMSARPATALAQDTRADAAAQVTPPPEPARGVEKKLGPAEIIMPHITDSKTIELPWFNRELAKEITFPVWNVTIGGHTYDFGLTKHIFWMLVSAAMVLLFLLTTAARHKRNAAEFGRPKGRAAGLEAVVLYLRNEVFMPVLGHGGERYVPFCLTLFFFILFCNAFGLIPYGSTATGNVGVTATLAAVTFVMIEIAGMRALGKGYINTIVYWPHDMPLMMKLPMTVIMTPVELIGKFTKPFALTIRLFANMIAGHVIILALIGMIFLFGVYSTFVLPIGMATFIMLLEILVAVIQAFIFALLAAVFIGQIRSAHH